MEIPKGRNFQLDGLRAFAFLFVFVHHSLNVPLLWCGVDLFFVLSGFLITGILISDISPRSIFALFYYRRFLRIFPAYYLVLFVVFAFLALNWKDFWYWYVFYASNFQHVLGYEGYPGLVPTWSLAIEEQFYLLWPLLVFLLGRKGMWRLTLFLLVAAPLFRLWTTFAFEKHWAAYMLLPSRIDLLALGALLALLLRKSSSSFEYISNRGLLFSLAGALLFGIFAVAFPDFRTGANSVVFNVFGYSFVLIMMGGIIAYFVPVRENFMGRVLTSPPIVYLGSISYMMYLIHQIILHQVGTLGLNRFAASALSLAIVIGLSAFSWHFFEKPIQKLRALLPSKKSEGFMTGNSYSKVGVKAD